MPILVTGGALHEAEPPIATVMADSLVHDFQVPVQWIETASRDTWENAHLSAAILREQGITLGLRRDPGLAYAPGDHGLRGYGDHGHRRADPGSIGFPR